VTLWLFLLTPIVVHAQEAPPVNGEWPAGLQFTVRPGDTLLTVSVEMGLDLEQVACLISPSFQWEQPLVVGHTLSVPRTPFICHTVQPGETLAAIAAQYGVTVADIAAHIAADIAAGFITGITPETWRLGAKDASIRNLRIPLTQAVTPAMPNSLSASLPIAARWHTPIGTGGPSALTPLPTPQLPLPANWPYGSGSFAWPVYGWITQSYHTGHSAIDVGAWADTPVTAADRGVVVRAGWSDIGYGNFVVIDHKIDYLTLYAHLGDILVSEGQVVAQGAQIGTVGSTGNSTGPHLHFEIRDFGRRVDPLGLLGR